MSQFHKTSAFDILGPELISRNPYISSFMIWNSAMIFYNYNFGLQFMNEWSYIEYISMKMDICSILKYKKLFWKLGLYSSTPLRPPLDWWNLKPIIQIRTELQKLNHNNYQNGEKTWKTMIDGLKSFMRLWIAHKFTRTS